MGENFFRIAVFTDNEGIPDDFCFAKTMDMYIRSSGKWIREKSVALSPMNAKSVGQIRAETFERLKLMGDCRVIAAKELSGIPFSVFDMAGFLIFIIDKVSEENLNGVVADIENADEAERIKSEIIENAKPVETEDGYYYMDLIALQTECPEVSSKAALKDFLENTPFMELKLRCSHIPPWIEKSGQYEVDVKDSVNNEVTAVIKKKLCRE